MRYLASLVAFSVFLLFYPHAHAASTHHYICSEFTLGGGVLASCTGSTITFNSNTSTGPSLTAYDSAPTFDLEPTKTWYVSFVVTRSGGDNIRLRCYNGVQFDCPTSGTAGVSVSSTIVDQAITSSSATAHTGIYFSNDFGPVLYYNGTISAICVSDTIGACAGGVPFQLWKSFLF